MTSSRKSEGSKGSLRTRRNVLPDRDLDVIVLLDHRTRAWNHRLYPVVVGFDVGGHVLEHPGEWDVRAVAATASAAGSPSRVAPMRLGSTRVGDNPFDTSISTTEPWRTRSPGSGSEATTVSSGSSEFTNLMSASRPAWS